MSAFKTLAVSADNTTSDEESKITPPNIMNIKSEEVKGSEIIELSNCVKK